MIDRVLVLFICDNRKPSEESRYCWAIYSRGKFLHVSAPEVLDDIQSTLVSHLHSHPDSIPEEECQTKAVLSYGREGMMSVYITDPRYDKERTEHISKNFRSMLDVARIEELAHE